MPRWGQSFLQAHMQCAIAQLSLLLLIALILLHASMYNAFAPRDCTGRCPSRAGVKGWVSHVPGEGRPSLDFHKRFIERAAKSPQPLHVWLTQRFQKNVGLL